MKWREKMMDFTRKMSGLRNEKSLSTLENSYQPVLSEVKNTGKEIEQTSIKQQEKAQLTQPLYKQMEEESYKTWEVDPFSNNKIATTMIQRDEQVQMVTVEEVKIGDVLLEPYTDDLYNSKGAIIDQFNLKVDYLDKQYVKVGEVFHLNELELSDFKEGHVKYYSDFLADYSVDKQLVRKEFVMFNPANPLENPFVSKALERNGELDNVIDRTLSLNQLSAGQSYKVIDFITADGVGKNNKILYLEDEKGNTKSYGIGKQIDSIDYQKGQSIRLEDVLRNSVSLLEKSCQNIEKRREVEISQEVAMER